MTCERVRLTPLCRFPFNKCLSLHVHVALEDILWNSWYLVGNVCLCMSHNNQLLSQSVIVKMPFFELAF